MDDRRELLR